MCQIDMQGPNFWINKGLPVFPSVLSSIFEKSGRPRPLATAWPWSIPPIRINFDYYKNDSYLPPFSSSSSYMLTFITCLKYSVNLIMASPSSALFITSLSHFDKTVMVTFNKKKCQNNVLQ